MLPSYCWLGREAPNTAGGRKYSVLMRIAVVGAGAVGGYFGGRLAESGADVRFVARGPHLQALRAKGLRLISPKGDAHVPRVNATDDPAAIGPVDVVMFTVKMYDADAAGRLLPPLLGADTIVLPFQNGVDGVDIVRKTVGDRHAGGGTCYVSAVISEPGVIRHTAMDHLIFGELDGSRSPRLERFLECCRRANFQSTLSNRIATDIWGKFTRLSVMAGMTTVTRCPIGVVVGDAELFAMLERAVAEAMAVANANGIAMAPDMVADVGQAYRALPPQTKASMLEDLERGRPLELPWLSGAIVRMGRAAGVPTPTHQFISAVLGPYVKGSA